MRLLGVVQARMSSARLPGKSLRLLGAETVLGRVVRSVRTASCVDELVVATSTASEDDAIAQECARLDVACHRGSRDDVLARFMGALRAHPADAVMRFTADCPFLCPATLALVADAYRGVPDLDYVSTALRRTLPRGMDAEVAGSAALARADASAEGFHRAHVTSYLYSHPEQFSVLGLDFLPDHGDLRVTVDTEEDWQMALLIHQRFGAHQPTPAELGAWLRARPEVLAVNAAIEQKRLAEG